ncbi:phosphatidylglycerophosphatase A [Saprospiraceae bacterium]|nr:phosphatidylglycerophosphatase A [Saprospiraceae bacterium]
MLWLHKAIATVLGLGYAPKGPGTFGTLGGVIFLGILLHFNIPFSLAALLITIVVTFVLGTYSTNQLIPQWGEDPQSVVMDEFNGYLITMILVPLSWTTILLGFVLFRFFDILKPLGIRTIDTKVKGGLGVMLDDVLAGVYALICMHVYLYFI